MINQLSSHEKNRLKCKNKSNFKNSHDGQGCSRPISLISSSQLSPKRTTPVEVYDTDVRSIRSATVRLLVNFYHDALRI